MTNPIRPLLAVLMVGFLSMGYASTPEEEATFLTVLRSALESKNVDELVALSCWDRVPADIKTMTIQGIAQLTEDPIKSVTYQALDDSVSATRTLNGVVYAPNLPITKQVKIEYDMKVGNSSATLLIGEKDGKLLVANLAPQE